MPSQNYSTEADRASADIRTEVTAANKERREVQLTDAQLESLGHAKRNPIKVIRAFCIRCMGGNVAEIRRCTSPGCALWPYRLGTNPFTSRKGPGFAGPDARSPIQDESGEQTENPLPTSLEGAER